VLGASVNYSPEFDASGPNLPLLRRLAELGGGKLLDPVSENPFRIGRLKTFQPRDLWDVLLRLVVCLFVLDVGFRRVDIDREEWARWLDRTLARFGLGGGRRAAEAQEAMSALLARKGEVRARQADRAEPVVVIPTRPREDLFSPREAPPTAPGPFPASESPRMDGGTSSPPGATPAAPPEGTSRLLEAKRKAQRKR
jgi:hypothetical protein